MPATSRLTGPLGLSTLLTMTEAAPPPTSRPIVGLWQTIQGVFHSFEALNFIEGRRPRLIVGSGPRAHIQIAQSVISEQHFELRYRGGAVIIRDLTSTNGTYVNGEQLVGDDTRKLLPQTRIVVGTTELIGVDASLSVPITAATHSSFLRKSVTTHGSDSAAARAVGKSRHTIARARRRDSS